MRTMQPGCAFGYITERHSVTSAGQSHLTMHLSEYFPFGKQSMAVSHRGVLRMRSRHAGSKLQAVMVLWSHQVNLMFIRRAARAGASRGKACEVWSSRTREITASSTRCSQGHSVQQDPNHHTVGVRRWWEPALRWGRLLVLFMKTIMAAPGEWKLLLIFKLFVFAFWSIKAKYDQGSKSCQTLKKE